MIKERGSLPRAHEHSDEMSASVYEGPPERNAIEATDDDKLDREQPPWGFAPSRQTPVLGP